MSPKQRAQQQNNTGRAVLPILCSSESSFLFVHVREVEIRLSAGLLWSECASMVYCVCKLSPQMVLLGDGRSFGSLEEHAWIMGVCL